MKLKRRWMAVVLVCFIFSAGCGAGKQVYLEAATEAQTEENTQTEAETAEAAGTETSDTSVKEFQSRRQPRSVCKRRREAAMCICAVLL